MVRLGVETVEDAVDCIVREKRVANGYQNTDEGLSRDAELAAETVQIPGLDIWTAPLLGLNRLTVTES